MIGQHTQTNQQFSRSLSQMCDDLSASMARIRAESRRKNIKKKSVKKHDPYPLGTILRDKIKVWSERRKTKSGRWAWNVKCIDCGKRNVFCITEMKHGNRDCKCLSAVNKEVKNEQLTN